MAKKVELESFESTQEGVLTPFPIETWLNYVVKSLSFVILNSNYYAYYLTSKDYSIFFRRFEIDSFLSQGFCNFESTYDLYYFAYVFVGLFSFCYYFNLPTIEFQSLWALDPIIDFFMEALLSNLVLLRTDKYFNYFLRDRWIFALFLLS